MLSLHTESIKRKTNKRKIQEMCANSVRRRVCWKEFQFSSHNYFLEQISNSISWRVRVYSCRSFRRHYIPLDTYNIYHPVVDFRLRKHMQVGHAAQVLSNFSKVKTKE
jgi:hypothetical protein